MKIIHWLFNRPIFCWPWDHEWKVTRDITVPIWDPKAKGELWKCRHCPKMKAK